MIFISIPVDSWEVTAFYDRLGGSYAHHFQRAKGQIIPRSSNPDFYSYLLTFRGIFLSELVTLHAHVISLHSYVCTFAGKTAGLYMVIWF